MEEMRVVQECAQHLRYCLLVSITSRNDSLCLLMASVVSKTNRHDSLCLLMTSLVSKTNRNDSIRLLMATSCGTLTETTAYAF